MKTGPALAASLLVALAVGAALWTIREQRAAECRRAVAESSPRLIGSPEIDAALVAVAEQSREIARECYIEGFIESPGG